MADSSVEIKITADSAGAVAGVKAVGGAVDAVGGAVDGLSAKQAGVASATQASAQSQVGSHQRIRDGVTGIGTQLDTLRGQIVAAFGVQVGAQLISDVAKTADAFNSLSSRIQLVTGDGNAFKTAFEGVKAIAVATRSDLESTGILFSKIAEAGKAMGVSQQQALAITQTINQAIQVSGASASASQAAIQQLIQGLQSGVLRGDEFNSVMEQTPRVAKALADGLGVGTGELRKMAEAGDLTADVVIKALQRQSDAVAAEFAKLPATVGGALTNLSTAWTVYVGETDKASGASKAAAEAINALASNLGTIAGYLVDAGQAAAAFYAVGLAQKLLGIGQAATTAAGGIATSTAATVANTAAATANAAAQAAAARAQDASFKTIAGGVAAQVAALGQSTAAVGANTAATGKLGAALAEGAAKTSVFSTALGTIGTASSAAFGVAGQAVKGFAALLGGIPGIALLILSNVKDIGTWMGEFVAKHTSWGKQLADNEAKIAALDKQALDRSKEKQAALAAESAANDKAVESSKQAQKAAEDFLPVMEKGVKAVEAQAAAAIALIKVSGDEAAILRVTAEEGKKVADVREAQAVAMGNVVRAIEAHIAAIQKETDANGTLSKSQQDQIKGLEKLLPEKRLEAEQAGISAEAAKTEAVAREVLSDAYKDNSAKVKVYADAVENAKAKLEILKGSGVATSKQLADAQLEVNAATKKYTDALGDVVKSLQAKAKTEQSAFATAQSALGVQRDAIKATIEQATAEKDTAKVRSASIELIKVEAALAEKETAAKKAALTSIIAVNEAKLAAAKASGTLTNELKAEIEASTASAKAKLAEANAQKENNNAKQLASQANREVTQATVEMDAASKGLTGTMSAETKVKIDNAQAGVDSAKVAYEEALASGDETKAAEALVKVKEAELEMAKVLAAAKREEAKAARDVAKAKEAEAKAASETARAIAEEIANSETVTQAMKEQLAQAKVNAIAKAGAAKEAYAHADALDVEAKGLEKAVGTAERALKTAQGALQKTRNEANQTSQAFGNMAYAMTTAAREANRLAEAEAAVAREMVKAEQQAADLIATLGSATVSMEDVNSATNRAIILTGQLGEQKLSGLRAAIDSARQKLLDLAAAAKDTLNSVLDELDQANSNLDAVEQRQYEKRKAEIQKQLEAAQKSQNFEVQKDLQLALEKLDVLHQINAENAKNDSNEARKGRIDKAKKDGAENLPDPGLEDYNRQERGGVRPDIQNAEKQAKEQARLKKLDDDNAERTRQQLEKFAQQRKDDEAKALADKATKPDPTGTGTGTQSTGGGTSRTVNITINGSTRSVNVASDSDASTLQSVLQQLADAANRSV